MKVLVITKVFPNAVEPDACPYNLNQFSALSQHCSVDILALIPWFPGRRLGARLAGGAVPPRVPYRSHLRGLSVRHPRVLYVPKVGQGLAGATYAASLLPFLPSARDVDVVLGAFAFPDGWAAVTLGRLLRVPTVIKVHGSDINVVSRDRWLRPRLREALSGAVAVVGPSQELIDLAVKHGANPETSRVIKNGVDRERFYVRDRAVCREQLGWGGERRVILFVGRLEPAKGIFELLEAFETLQRERSDVDLVLIGDGVAEQECRRVVNERRLSVHFLGKRSRDEVASWLGAADLLTLPSWNEGTPNVVLEALSSGRRVVTSNVGGIPAVVTQPELGEMVPPKDAKQLAVALGRAAATDYDPEQVVSTANLNTWGDSGAQLHDVLRAARQRHSGFHASTQR